MADIEGTPANGNSLMGNAANAFDSVANGPVLRNVKDQKTRTTGEFSNLAASRKSPVNPAATGQTLTHYHSFFSELLSWNNPRVSAIVYASIISVIFAARYLDVVRYAFKVTWMVLGVTVAAEAAGKAMLNNGFATQMRPRQYYKVPREALDTLIGDVHELVNFFVIEAQRILFAENVPNSALAAFSAFLSYYLVRIVPYWGLAAIFTTMAFFIPLVYKSNQELIDNTIQQAADVVNAQTAQLRDVASKHTAQATSITKQYMGDYTNKAQQMLRRSVSPEAEVEPEMEKEPEFPSAPTNIPGQSQSTAEQRESLLAN